MVLSSFSHASSVSFGFVERHSLYDGRSPPLVLTAYANGSKYIVGPSHSGTTA